MTVSRRWSVAGASAATVLLLASTVLAVRGWSGATDSAARDQHPQSTAGLLPRAGYQPHDDQQTEECDGLPPVDPTDLRLLDPAAQVQEAVICGTLVEHRPGDGEWLMRDALQVPPASIPALTAGLTGPDAARRASCTASSTVLAGFVLTLADGTRVRPGVPGDGCHIAASALTALDAAAAVARAGSTVPVSQVATEQEVTTGCVRHASSPADWLDAAGALPTTMLPTAGDVVVCRYTPDGSPSYGRLAATGTATAGAITDAVADLSDDALPECPWPSATHDAPATDWLAIQPMPSSVDEGGSDPPLLLVETAGCRRVVDGSTLTTRGYLSTSAATNLAELADHPTS